MILKISDRLEQMLKEVLKIDVKYTSNTGYGTPHKFETCELCGFPLHKERREEIYKEILDEIYKLITEAEQKKGE